MVRRVVGRVEMVLEDKMGMCIGVEGTERESKGNSKTRYGIQTFGEGYV